MAESSTLPPVVRPPIAIEYSHENIQKRAYSLYMARTAMSLPGSALSDWAQADRELREFATETRSVEPGR